MTIEERLERLTERHEALTQSIELMHRDFESRSTEYQLRFGQVTQTFETCLDSIKRLERIAVAHEDRIEGLEGR